MKIALGVSIALLGGGCALPDAGRGAEPGVLAWSEPIADEVRRIGQHAVEEDGMVGVAIGVAIDGRLVYTQGFGHADVGRTVPVEPATVFDIASVGKQFTAAAVLRLAEQGKLRLSQRARELVPELPEHFPNATIEELLRHTSGFVGGELDESDAPANYARRRYGVDLLTDIELQGGTAVYRVGESWVYCNPGYLVLGIVVEKASGMRYDEFVRTQLLAPIGLASVTVCERVEGPLMSNAIARTESGIAEVPFIDMTAYSGQGSICSSVVDLLAWSRALNTGRVIEPASLAQMRSPSRVRGDADVREVPYGMAQRLGAIGEHRKVGHTGTFDGGSAALAYYPDAGLEIAVLSNTRGNGTPHAYSIEAAIAKLVLGHEDPDVRALARPVTPAQRRAIEGVYTEGAVRFGAAIEADELVVTRNGKEIERLVHLGGMRFRRPDRPDIFEWFEMDGETAGWWVYSVSGNYVGVSRREGATDAR
ncbi:MAG: hypothetical protein DHS20C14_14600 [Phycisphaeraceae bacterium]|nr:MAG: hypothetical protein DHS20C14_14600 [Phycisphaeraceae bacterium]